MGMTAHCDVLRSLQHSQVEILRAPKRNRILQPDLSGRQKKSERRREKKRTLSRWKRKKKKEQRRSAVVFGTLARGRRRGAVWPWNGMGRPCRISRWRRISLAPADTMQICVRVSSHDPNLDTVRFPDSPIQHARPPNSSLERRRTSSKRSRVWRWVNPRSFIRV